MARYATCIHEAGHCVVLWHLGYEVAVVHARVSGSTLPSPSRPLRPEDQAVVALGGWIAEQKELGQVLRLQSDDQALLDDALRKMSGTSDEQSRQAQAQAELIVAKRWQAVKDVAGLLQRENRTASNPLDGDQVAETARRRWGCRRSRAVRTQAQRWRKRTG